MELCHLQQWLVRPATPLRTVARTRRRANNKVLVTSGGTPAEANRCWPAQPPPPSRCRWTALGFTSFPSFLSFLPPPVPVEQVCLRVHLRGQRDDPVPDYCLPCLFLQCPRSHPPPFSFSSSLCFTALCAPRLCSRPTGVLTEASPTPLTASICQRYI